MAQLAVYDPEIMDSNPDWVEPRVCSPFNKFFCQIHTTYTIVYLQKSHRPSIFRKILPESTIPAMKNC